MNYDLHLKKKMKQIEKRILAKYKVKKRIDIENLGKQPRRGRVKDEKAETIRDTFSLSKGILNLWKNGSQGVGRQRLYALLYSLDIEVYKELQNIIKERIV